MSQPKIYDLLETMKFVDQLDKTIVKIFKRANKFTDPLSIVAVSSAISTLSELVQKIKNQDLKTHEIVCYISEAINDMQLIDKMHRPLVGEWVTWLTDLKTDYYIAIHEEV